MKNLVDNIIKLELNEIESYNFPIDEVFGLEVINKNIKFCFIIKFSSKNKNLICCGAGASSRNSKTSKGILKKPPYFSGWSWYSIFDDSFIAYADPIFFYDDEITLGWYVGDKNQWYIETISTIIKKLTINQRIQNKNILLYGSSGGGFASICLGTLIKESKVLVNNTQFNILNYYDRHINNLLDFLKKEFEGLSETEILNKLNYRLNTVELFKREKYIPKIDYYLNIASKPDIKRHCLPFIDDLNGLNYFNNELTIHFYREEKDNPHRPLPSNESISLIKSFVEKYLNNP